MSKFILRKIRLHRLALQPAIRDATRISEDRDLRLRSELRGIYGGTNRYAVADQLAVLESLQFGNKSFSPNGIDSEMDQGIPATSRSLLQAKLSH